ncbi:regulatory protein GemA [Vibrio sp. YMD68]|uniref:regulatory protein GemA n=1 Tax=Vibrio sp. YMD68 TaxID=3042300 RepID=UPI00249ABECD|nr:regulatory protein GemA [Vibrio sp. YMD68]WGV98846.1 regulatory protein GemA [Vibrio sp. YMD68]WGW01227.1 regulatory protein GemA [Vibrio sp. YMD68]
MNRKTAYVQLGIASKFFSDDDEYRAFLSRYGAKKKGERVSASTMSLAQLMQACHECKRLGFIKFVSKGKKRQSHSGQAKKCYALWCELHQQGAVDNKRWQAMEAWAVKHLGLISERTSLDEATSYEWNLCIEGLKQWLRRL